jgi:hypothetical protein
MRMKEDTTTSKQETMKKGHTTPMRTKYNTQIERTWTKNKKETTSKKEQKMTAKKTTMTQKRGPRITIKSVIRSVTFYV